MKQYITYACAVSMMFFGQINAENEMLQALSQDDITLAQQCLDMQIAQHIDVTTFYQMIEAMRDKYSTKRYIALREQALEKFLEYSSLLTPGLDKTIEALIQALNFKNMVLKDFVNEVDELGKTALHLAIAHAQISTFDVTLQFIEILIFLGANRLAQDVDGNTPLHTLVLKALNTGEDGATWRFENDVFDRLARPEGYRWDTKLFMLRNNENKTAHEYTFGGGGGFKLPWIFESSIKEGWYPDQGTPEDWKYDEWSMALYRVSEFESYKLFNIGLMPKQEECHVVPLSSSHFSTTQK